MRWLGGESRDSEALTGLADVGAVDLRAERAFTFPLPLQAVPPLVLPLVAVLTLAFFDGGYWPTAWGWSGVSLAFAAVLALVLREPRLGRLDVAFLAALAAVLVWTLASGAWSEAPGRSVLESHRTGVFLGGVGALLLLAERRHYRAVLGATWVAVTLVSTYALATKAFPGTFERFDSVAGYRLAEPFGYWNGLGAFCALGAMLAIGLAAHSHSLLARALAAGSLPILLVTIYFTFSRGSWIALCAGALVLAAVESRRLRVAAVVLPLVLPSALALAAAYRSDALTVRAAPLPQAIDAGRDLTAVVLLASLASCLIALGTSWSERRFAVPEWLRRGFAAALLGIVIVAAAVGLARAGGPFELRERVSDAFTATPTQVNVGESANVRLFSLSNNGRFDHWRVARDQAHERPLTGTGAGTYERYWAANRPIPVQVRDAHSLYLETLAELGIVGLALLGLALLVPVVGAFVARRRALVPTALAAYVVFVTHAAVDWDWELPALTLAALFCGAAIVLAARAEVSPLSLRARSAGVGVALVVSAFALVGLIGASALDGGWDALARGESAEALEQAEVAERWSPWSSEPLQLAAAAAALDDDDAAARAYLRRAVDLDPGDWNTWFDLAQVSEGADKRAALARALRLNPLGGELAQYMRANGIGTEDLPDVP